MIPELHQWFVEHQPELEKLGLTVTYEESAAHISKRSAWLDADSETRVGRLHVWQSGEAHLLVAEVATGGIVADENRQIETALGLEDAAQSLIAFVTRAGSP